jgi:hypothetical protein
MPSSTSFFWIVVNYFGITEVLMRDDVQNMSIIFLERFKYFSFHPVTFGKIIIVRFAQILNRNISARLSTKYHIG